MSEMSEARLAEIEARAEAASPWNDTNGFTVCNEDVPALIAELRRLRAEVAALSEPAPWTGSGPYCLDHLCHVCRERTGGTKMHAEIAKLRASLQLVGILYRDHTPEADQEIAKVLEVLRPPEEDTDGE